MVVSNPPSQHDKIQFLLNELKEQMVDLPFDQRDRIDATLQKIRHCFAGPGPTEENDNPSTQLLEQTENLSASEIKYRELAESISDPFAVYDTNLRILYRNKAAVDATQIPYEQTLGKSFAELYPDLVGSEIHQLYLQVLLNHQPQKYLSHWLRSTDNREFYFDLSLYPTRDGLIVFSKDITELVRADIAHQEAHKQAVWMSRFPDENPNPVVRVSVAGTILYCNKASAEPSIWALKIGERISSPFLVLVEEAILQGRQVDRDVQVGSRFYSITVMPFSQDQYVNLYGLDITERKQIENALQESEVRERARANELEAIMDAAPAIIWISRDPDCREMIGNRFSYDFLNIAHGENVSKSAPHENLDVQHYHMEKDGRVVPPSELPMQIAAATGKPERDYMADIVYEDGTRFSLLGNVNPLIDQAGKPYGAISVFVDLTSLRRLETERVMAKAEIEVQRRLMDQRERERQAIARDLHDGPIQTLSSTVFHLQMIKEIFADQALHAELNRVGMDIKNSIQEIRDVLNELRPPALMHFGLTRMIQMYTEDLCKRFPHISIELDLMADGNEDLSDPARLALFRIFQAGINNIVRHSGAKKAWIIYKVEQDAFRLEFHDNGNGFEITNDFTQLTRSGHFGLVGMKERAEAIGGEFFVSSELNQGTTIVVKGPVLGRNMKFRV
jgi:PAS domain S-box-containing protein